MNDVVALTALVLASVGTAAQVCTLAFLLHKRLARPLLPATVRLSWGVAQAAYFWLSQLIPGHWSAVFAPVMFNYWLVTIVLIAWMWWDGWGLGTRHPLSRMVFYYFGGSMLVSGVVPLLHHWLRTDFQAGIVAGAVILACGFLVVRSTQMGGVPECRLVWRRDGTCRIEPNPTAPDYYVRHPELILEMVSHAADASYRQPLLELLHLRIRREQGLRSSAHAHEGQEELS